MYEHFIHFMLYILQSPGEKMLFQGRFRSMHFQVSLSNLQCVIKVFSANFVPLYANCKLPTLILMSLYLRPISKLLLTSPMGVWSWLLWFPWPGSTVCITWKKILARSHKSLLPSCSFRDSVRRFYKNIDFNLINDLL